MTDSLLRALSLFLSLCAFLASSTATRAEHEGQVQVLLLGDSTTIGSVCRKVEPKGPHLEDVIRALVATEPGLPPVNVINQGRDGEFVHGLLGARYDRDIAKLPGIDYIFIRYGINDFNKRENFKDNFPTDYKALLARLRKDFPSAGIVPMTIIPYMSEEKDALVNGLIRQVAEEEKLHVFDIHARYAAELKHGQNMLNYRRTPLTQIPERHHAWVQPFVQSGSVVVMDNRLDAHFRDVPGWFNDRHPNLAGYHVIGDETAKYLANLLRKRRE